MICTPTSDSTIKIQFNSMGCSFSCQGYAILLAGGNLLMKFFKSFKKEKKDYELFSKHVNRSITDSQKKQQQMQKKNEEFAQQIQRSMLNHSK